MKRIKMALLAILTIFSVTSINAQTKKHSDAKHQHTTVYQCPMKCEADKTYDKAGKCPKCNMNLKEVTKTVATADAFKCPMKCEGTKTYSKAGKCPECNMNLKKVKSVKS